MKRTCRSYIIATSTTWTIDQRQRGIGVTCCSCQAVSILHVHDRRGALYQGGAGRDLQERHMYNGMFFSGRSPKEPLPMIKR